MSKELTPAKKAAIKKYLKRFSQFVVRMNDDDFKRLNRAAEAAGKSRAAFVRDAIDEAINRLTGKAGR